MSWQLAEARNRFSELVTKALTEGPQRVRRRSDTVVVISEEEYQRLTGERPTLLEYLLAGPDFHGMDLERDKTPMRGITW